MSQPKLYSSGHSSTGFTNEFGQRIFMEADTKGGRRMRIAMERDEEPVFDAVLSDEEGYQLYQSLRGLFHHVQPKNNMSDLDPPVVRFYRTQIADGHDPYPGMVQHSHGIYVTHDSWQAMKNAYDGAREEIAILKKQLAEANKPAYISPTEDKCPTCNGGVASYSKDIGCTQRTCLFGHSWKRESNSFKSK